MNRWTCAQCGSDAWEEGFLKQPYTRPRFGRWVSGPLERDAFGTAKLFGRQRWIIDAWRCMVCSRLDLYARRPDG
ncbi:hypothetical protein [Streptomyces sedi]|uniref:Uncharacterized protein n=1 Tax=Streptomyces sedi TaxID=555059 RepID=A0A5C4V0H1_9ACTN|nr:hypothetical protein [Streptomyces sedi]TNM29520.1 hypothetical protein FH715_15435 [Streptomyces sedi]